MKLAVGGKYCLRGGGVARITLRRGDLGCWGSGDLHVVTFEGRIDGVWGAVFWWEDGKYSPIKGALSPLDIVAEEKGGDRKAAPRVVSGKGNRAPGSGGTSNP